MDSLNTAAKPPFCVAPWVELGENQNSNDGRGQGFQWEKEAKGV